MRKYAPLLLIMLVLFTATVLVYDSRNEPASAVKTTGHLSLLEKVLLKPSSEEKAGCTNDDYDRLRDFPVRSSNGSDRYDIAYSPYYERPSPTIDGATRVCAFEALGDDVGTAYMWIKIGSYDKGGGNLVWYYHARGNEPIHTTGVALTAGSDRCVIIKFGTKIDDDVYKRSVRGITCN